MRMNIDFLANSHAMILLKVGGWDVSWGIKNYVSYCSKNNISVCELSPDNLEQNIKKLVTKL